MRRARPSSQRKVRLSRSRHGTFLVYLLLLILALFMAFPILFIVVNAFKPINELFLFPPRLTVRHPTLDNFAALSQLAQSSWVPFGRYMFNSLFVAVAGTAFYILIASMAAYPLAKMTFPGSGAYVKTLVVIMLFQPAVLGIPQYIIISQMGLLNTYWAVILPASSGTLGVFLMRQFMVSIPDAMLEAARIDGASPWTVYWRVIMPMVKPAWLTLLIFTFQSLWNNTGVAYVYDESMKALPVMLSQIVSAGVARAGAGAAVGLLLLVPPLGIFAAAQGSVLDTMAHSGIKE